jgi:hypothetical protein
MRRGGAIPNHGGGPTRRRPSLGRATYVLSGALRFVDRPGERAALRVEGGNAAGRRFVGQTVTLDLAGAEIGARDRNRDGAISLADLAVGDHVVVSTRLPRGLIEPPAMITVRRLRAGEGDER